MKNRYLFYRTLFVAALVVWAVVLISPTLLGHPPLGFLPDTRLRLGLDLQGGTHLILSVDVDKAVENSLEVNGEQLRRDLREKGVTLKKLERKSGNVVELVYDAASRDAVKSVLAEQYPNFRVGESRTEEGTIVEQIKLDDREVARLREAAVDQSLETIRNRIDQFGVSEPIIQRQGDRDIVVQLPGVQDPQRAKELIGRTAVLEFKLVRSDVDVEAIASGKQPLPAGTQILYGVEKGQTGSERRRGKPDLVETRTLMTGDAITDAKVTTGQLPNSRVVIMNMNSRGARIFDQLTAANVGRQMAIVLDNTVYSAPVIRERIGGGTAQIEGDFTPEEARDLAIVLRSGALPAPVTISEERTVGPSLGKDSIAQGIRSFIVAGAMVMLFMLVYYRFAGLLADFALTLNALFMLAALSLLQATLTLPGIAGIVLTLGMAVDANVLINERIREELRAGKSARAAIEAGYDRALPSILDSNITTLLSGVVLFQFGSGPIRGFAVTLCVGLIIHVFTAVFCTRVVWDHLLLRRRMQTVSI